MMDHLHHVDPGDTFSLTVNDWGEITGTHRVIRPLDIPCKRCGAEPGSICTRIVRRPRNNWVKIPRQPHPDRLRDAERVTEAARALLGEFK